jgi:predicted nucleotide-binding protein
VSTPNRKPNLFIGSSSEAIPYARAIHEQLSRKAQVTPWYGGAFLANDYTMEALERQLDQSDFGVFVFAPDDVALIRGKHVFVTRDNTLFEMGMFWGKLRRNRVFCIVPREVAERDDLFAGVKVKEYHLLSDLQGLTLLTYESRTDGNYHAAVDVACGHILNKIDAHGVYSDPADLLKSQQSVLQFLWEYNRNISAAEPKEQYQALTEAVRNSLLPPDGFRVTGSAVWQKVGTEGITQVGGNVGKGRFFPFQGNMEVAEKQQKIYVIDAYLSGQWSFFKRMQVVAHVYVLCYPLGTEHVLSVHISGQAELSDEELADVVTSNGDLLNTINDLVGGDA